MENFVVLCAAFVFGDRYGKLGTGFIECHHIRPLHRLLPGEKTRLSDLVLVCSKCHRMFHRADALLSVDELRASIVGLLQN